MDDLGGPLFSSKAHVRSIAPWMDSGPNLNGFREHDGFKPLGMVPDP